MPRHDVRFLFHTQIILLSLNYLIQFMPLVTRAKAKETEVDGPKNKRKKKTTEEIRKGLPDYLIFFVRMCISDLSTT